MTVGGEVLLGSTLTNLNERKFVPSAAILNPRKRTLQLEKAVGHRGLSWNSMRNNKCC